MVHRNCTERSLLWSRDSIRRGRTSAAPTPGGGTNGKVDRVPTNYAWAIPSLSPAGGETKLDGYGDRTNKKIRRKYGGTKRLATNLTY